MSWKSPNTRLIKSHIFLISMVPVHNNWAASVTTDFYWVEKFWSLVQRVLNELPNCYQNKTRGHRTAKWKSFGGWTLNNGNTSVTRWDKNTIIIQLNHNSTSCQTIYFSTVLFPCWNHFGIFWKNELQYKLMNWGWNW